MGCYGFVMVNCAYTHYLSIYLFNLNIICFFFCLRRQTKGSFLDTPLEDIISRGKEETDEGRSLQTSLKKIKNKIQVNFCIRKLWSSCEKTAMLWERRGIQNLCTQAGGDVSTPS